MTRKISLEFCVLMLSLQDDKFGVCFVLHYQHEVMTFDHKTPNTFESISIAYLANYCLAKTQKRYLAVALNM
jgi:hypothetical protein